MALSETAATPVSDVSPAATAAAPAVATAPTDAGAVPAVAPVEPVAAVEPEAKPAEPDLDAQRAAEADAALERVDSQTDAEIAAAAAAAMAAPAKPAGPVIPNFASASEIASALDGGHVPAEAAPWVRSALATIRPLEARIGAAEQEYAQAKERFLKAAADIEGQGAQGATVMAGKMSELVDNVENMTSEVIETSAALFNAKFPEYDKLPPGHPVREMVVKMWTDGTADRAFTGKYHERMEQVYKFAQFKTGHLLGASAPAKPTTQANPHAAQQALVNEGRQGTQRPVRDVDEVSMDEILAQHDHLL